MKFYAALFIIVWILMIIYPDLVGIILGSFLIFIWLNLFFISRISSWFMDSFKNNKSKDKSYVKFWEYKIFK
jgi:ABC-type bacteriocin/lantibiotic exporter with double-glycine peptidase domain